MSAHTRITDIKSILAITRALIGLATSLHLYSLSSAIKASALSVKRTKNYTDAALRTHSRAVAVAAAARSYAKDRQLVERLHVKEHKDFVAAAVAEADSLRREHTVGA